MKLEVTNRDPAAEQFNAALTTALFVLIGMAFGIVVASVLTSATSLLGWLIITTVTVTGLFPLVRWLHDRHRDDRISLSGLGAGWKRQLTVGVAAVNRIDDARRCLPAGAAADHLDLVHETAMEHLRAIECAARGPRPRHALPDGAILVHQLNELATASNELVRAAQPEGSPRLEELIDRTRLLSTALVEENEDLTGQR